MTVQKNQNTPSPETQAEAMRIAKATQKPGQTKDQTKLVAAGIQKGIELYKKQQKAKARERDKLRKKQVSGKQVSGKQEQSNEQVAATPEQVVIHRQHWLPWVLLFASWAGFAAFLMQS